MIGGYIFSYVFIYFPNPHIYIYIFPYFACNPLCGLASGNLIAFYESSYLTAVNHRDKWAIFQSYVSLFFGVSIIGRLYPQFHMCIYIYIMYFHIFSWDRTHDKNRNWKWKEPRQNQGFWDGKGFRWSIHGEIHWFVQPRRTAKNGVDSYWLYHITFWYLAL